MRKVFRAAVGVLAITAAAVVLPVPAASATAAATPPTISGNALIGQNLTADPGTWNPPSSTRTFQYQWYRCRPSCTAVTSATTSVYTLSNADQGGRMRVRVGTSDTGFEVAYSTFSEFVVPPTTPANTGVPVLGGAAKVGEAITTTSGTWSYLPRSFTYAWERCASDGSACTTVAGATLDGYLPTNDDINHTFRSVVIAHGATDSAPAPSAVSSPVVAGALGDDDLTPAAVTTTLRPGESQAITDTLTLAAQPRRADIVLALDTTGSMGAALTTARSQAQQLVSQVRSSIPGARFAVADFQDPDLGTCIGSPCSFGSSVAGRPDHAYDLRQKLTYNAVAVERALIQLETNNGGDVPESYNRAFYEAATSTELGYSPGARRFLVVLGDAIPHDNTQQSSFPACPNTPTSADPGPDELAGTADDLRTAATLDQLALSGSRLLMVRFNAGTTLSCYAQLAARTGGRAVDGSTSTLATQIASEISTAATQINDVTMQVEPASLASWMTFGAATPPENSSGFRVAPTTLTIPSTVQVPTGTAPGVYTLNVTALADGAERGTQTVTVTVPEDVRISASSPTVGEDIGDALVTVSLSKPAENDVRFDVATTDASAVAGLDYTTVTQNVVIPTGQTSTTVRVPIIDDDVDEADEQLRVTLSNPVGAVIPSPVSHVTITDNDAAPTLSIEDTSTGEADTPLTFTVRKTGHTSQQVLVDVLLSAGTAEEGTDVVLPPMTRLVIEPNATSATINADVIDDALHEDDETVLATIVSANAAATILDGDAVGTIIDDDAAPLASVSDVSVTEDDDASRIVQVPVQLDAPSGLDADIGYTIYAGSAVDPTAIVRAGTVHITAGATAASIAVDAPGNLLDEADRAWLVVLDRFAGAGAGDQEALVTLADDDDAPTVSITGTTVSEADGVANVAVSLSAPSGRIVTVTLATIDGTAVSPLDFTSTTATLTFAPGETTQLLVVPVRSDVLDEDDVESFLVTASAASFATPGDSAPVRITDDDATPTVSVADVTILEPNTGSANAGIELALSAASGRDIHVRLRTVDGTATSAGDYTALDAVYLIPAGSTGTVAAVAITGDVAPEPTETFRVVLSDPVNAVVDDGNGTVTITDDDNRAPVCTGASPSLTELSPPDHRLVSVRVSGITDPDGDAVSTVVTGVTSDEPTNTRGDGDTPVDAFLGAADDVVALRAERAGMSDGRVYVVSFRSEDARGGTCTGTVAVGVRQGIFAAVDSGQAYDATR